MPDPLCLLAEYSVGFALDDICLVGCQRRGVQVAGVGPVAEQNQPHNAQQRCEEGHYVVKLGVHGVDDVIVTLHRRRMFLVLGRVEEGLAVEEYIAIVPWLTPDVGVGVGLAEGSRANMGVFEALHALEPSVLLLVANY